LDDERTSQRELQALTEVKDALKVDRLTVITDDGESHGEINIIPLWKWLIT